MSAYVIVDIEVKDAEGYEAYKKLAAPAVIACGGKYLARGGRVEVLEGEWLPKRLVILEFETMQKAKDWLNSAEYAPAKALRHKYAATNMVVVEGV
ncbi:MAG: DUF1330 domain-containing protein [Anaerolineae bacterium]|nr:DUF1330 domain-containing protein [Anaerolineae bacterium]